MICTCAHVDEGFFFRILISLFLIMCRCIYLHMGMWHEFRGQRLWIPWSWNCRLFWDTWHAWREPNSGLLEEQQVDLLAEPSLQPQWWKVFTAAGSYISQADRKHQYHLVSGQKILWMEFGNPCHYKLFHWIQGSLKFKNHGFVGQKCIPYICTPLEGAIECKAEPKGPLFGHTLHSISLVLQIKECRSVTIRVYLSESEAIFALQIVLCFDYVDWTIKKIVEKQTKCVEMNSLMIFMSFLLSLL